MNLFQSTMSRIFEKPIVVRFVGAVVLWLTVWIGMSFAAESLRAARAEEQRQSTALVAELIGRIEKLEARIRSNQVTLERKIASVEETTREGFSATSARLAVAQLEPAAISSAASSPDPAPPQGTGFLNMQIQACFNTAMKFAAGFKPKASGEANAEGGAGAKPAGTGVQAAAKGKVAIEAELELGAEHELSIQACIPIPAFKPTAAMGSPSPASAAIAEVVGPDGQFVQALKPGTFTLKQKLMQMIVDTNEFRMTGAAATLDNIMNFQMAPSPALFLQKLDNPQTMFAEAQGLIDSVPLPPSVRNFLNNPGTAVPTLNDLDVNTLCLNRTGTTLLGGICDKARLFVPLDFSTQFNNLQNTFTNLQGQFDTFNTNFSSQFTTLTGNVTSLTSNVSSVATNLNSMKSSYLGTCGDVNNRLQTVRNRTITVPSRQVTIQLPAIAGGNQTLTIPSISGIRLFPVGGLPSVSCTSPF